MAAEKVSGAAVFVMMAESFVPRGADLFVADLAKKEEKINIWPQLLIRFSGLKSWFGMVKTGVIGRDEDCTDGLR